MERTEKRESEEVSLLGVEKIEGVLRNEREEIEDLRIENNISQRLIPYENEEPLGG